MDSPMHTKAQIRGRLSTWAAAMVIARRDFCAILFSRSFIFFLIGPLFPVLVGGLAGSVGNHVERAAAQPAIGIIMAAPDVDAMLAAQTVLTPRLAGAIPQMVAVQRLTPGQKADPVAALKGKGTNGQNLAAILSGTPAAPVLTGTPDAIGQWQGPISLIAGRALGQGPAHWPQITLAGTITSTADTNHGRILTAQAGQTLLFLLTMLLAGMVLSNLVEEKGNKIIEILAAAIPMDAVFLGKLFAMLAVSFVGIAVWGAAGGTIAVLGGRSLGELTAPAVGWPVFFALGVAYFAMAYLLLGSLFLAIGSMASTVREVQTLSMPVTMLQLLVFFFASFAMTQQDSAIELAAAIVPFSSPFAMLARAAISPDIWTHVAALAWQALCVGLFVRWGAAMFRSRVMKSGPSGGKAQKRGLFAKLRPAAA